MPTVAPALRTVRIEETTVATVDGWKVTVANIMKGKYQTAGGEREGLTAVVGLYDDKKADQGERTVGLGSELRIAGKTWTVGDVQAGPGAQNGFVEIRQQ